ncbi:MAG: hypothetical protein IKE48_04575 [Parasporobacterium sp.]|nr:hypothetical protein [Parasporobacterium sp.]
MAELTYVLDKFHKVFQPYQGKRILIHGVREYAEAILERFDPLYHFIGIAGMEACEEQEIFGKQFFSNDQIESLNPDLIILTERVKYEEEAFQALRSLCEEKGILLFNMYGVDEIQSHRDFETTGYLSILQWKRRIQPYDIIVFELLNGFAEDIETPGEFHPRMQMLRLIRYMQDEGKQFFFSLRKSYPEEKQIELLRQSGIFSSEKELEESLIIREGEDLSLRRFSERHPGKKICYLGWGLVSEFLLPRYYGIQTFRISDQIYKFAAGTEELVNAFRSNSKSGKYDSEAVKERIKEADLISFDLFDTLLVRKVLYPADIFVFWERNALICFPDLSKGLREARMKAEKESDGGSIELVYQNLAKDLALDPEISGKLLKLEIETEKQFLVPRRQVAELLKFAAEQGKEVVICSDMYYPENLLRGFLEFFEIQGYQKIYVSCDYHKGKGNGLFDELRKDHVGKNKILHIGNDPDTDLVSAEKAGIEACFIPSPLDMAKEDCLKTAIERKKTFEEQCLLGLIIEELYREPFCDQNSREWQLREYGISACAPVILGYLSWLVHILKTETYDGVLFSSRDGYLLRRIYQMMQEKTASHLILPEAVYFYTNRHASFLSCMDDSALWDLCLDLGRHMSVEMILKSFFDIQENAFGQIRKDGISKRDILIECLPQIKEKAFKERHNYLQYTKRCGLRTEGNYVFSDFFAAGTTQHFLTQFLPFHMDGYFFGRPLYGKSNPLQINYYFDEKHQEMRERFMEMEYIMTSPEPSLKTFSEDGDPLFAPEIRDDESMKEIKEIHEMILQFSKEYIRLFFTDETVICADFAELLFCCGEYYGIMKAAYDDWGMFWIAEGEESNDD